MSILENLQHTQELSSTHQESSAFAVRLLSGYLLVCLLCFVVAYFGLSRKESVEWHTLQNSTLFYASRDHTSTAFAASVRTHFHIHTLDLLAPEAGETVHRLTGAWKAINPTLVIPSAGGVEVVSGPVAVDQALQPITARTTPIRKAQWALAFMAGLIILATIFEAELAKIVSFLPILGLIAIGALWGRCLNCDSGGSTLSTLAPVFGLIYLGAGMALFSRPLLQHRWLYIYFLLVSGAVPVLQAFMLVSEPKLCPSCLTITFISATYFVCALKTLSTSALSGIVAPKRVGIVMASALCLLLLRHSLILGGYINAGKPADGTIPSIIGASFSRFVPSLLHPQPGVLYVVTLEGCSHCRQAESDLPKSGINWSQVPVCTIAQRGVCFAGGKLNFPAPMLLMCDKNGRIVYQHEGWDSEPQGMVALEGQILNLQRRSIGHH